MSEYQYHEFVAVEQPLSVADQRALRDISSRAEISANRFANTYNYSDLRADPVDLLFAYFDLYVYVTNWGTHTFAVRLPIACAPWLASQPWFDDEDCWTAADDAHVIVAFTSQTEDHSWEDGEGWLGELAGVRALLLRGDERALYLAWLSTISERYGASSWGLGSESDEAADPAQRAALAAESVGAGGAVEVPTVPAGLGTLTPPLEALARFLRVDPHLLAAASDASPTHAPEPPASACLEGLAEADKDALLLRVLGGHAGEVAAVLHGRLSAVRPKTSRTTLGPETLLQRAAVLRRRAREEQEARDAADRARRQAEMAARREGRLNLLATDRERGWRVVERHVGATTQAGYDTALAQLIDLRDLAARDAHTAAFVARMQALHERHRRKVTFVRRLVEAGLVEGP